MSYYTGVYERFYMLVGSDGSWFFWVFGCLLIAMSVLGVHLFNHKHRVRITHGAIIFTLGSLILKILLWLFLPVPSGV